MPDFGLSCPGGGYADVPAHYGVSALSRKLLSKLDLTQHNLYLFTCCGALKSNGHLFDSSTSQGVSLPLGREQSELLLLIFTQTVAISAEVALSRGQSVPLTRPLTISLPDFIIVGWELLQQLLDTIFLSH